MTDTMRIIKLAEGLREARDIFALCAANSDNDLLARVAKNAVRDIDRLLQEVVP